MAQGPFDLSLNALQSETDAWTLQSDANLLQYLQNFSSSLITRTKDLQDSVDALSFDTATADVILLEVDGEESHFRGRRVVVVRRRCSRERWAAQAQHQ